MIQPGHEAQQQQQHEQQRSHHGQDIQPIADGHTHGGRVVGGEGIVPDEVVELTGPVRLLTHDTADDLTADELAATEDAQLLRALEILRATP